MDVDDVEGVEPRQAGDQRCVADRHHRVDPVHDRLARIGRVALGGGGEDLDVVAALSLPAREAVRGVAGPARIGGERGGQVCDPQRLQGGADDNAEGPP